MFDRSIERRLVTAGTIEEKVYHRQIYKQHLTNKVCDCSIRVRPRGFERRSAPPIDGPP